MGAVGKPNIKKLVWDISELTKVDKFLSQLKRKGIRIMQTELNKISMEILRNAKAKTPVLSGRLQFSGRVIRPSKSATNTRFKYQVVFGGITVSNKTGRGPTGPIHVDYAEKQENIHHFLEDAFNNALPKIESRIVGALRKEIKK